MQCNILVSEAFGFERLIQRIVGDAPALQGNKGVFAGESLAERNQVAEITLNTAAFVVVTAGAFPVIFFSGLEAVQKEIAHVAADVVKIFN